jgi:hypothetical protein
MKEWISEHPDVDNLDAFLLFEDNEEGCISYMEIDRTS